MYVASYVRVPRTDLNDSRRRVASRASRPVRGRGGSELVVVVHHNLGHNVISDTNWTNSEFGEKRAKTSSATGPSGALRHRPSGLMPGATPRLNGHGVRA